MIVAAPFPAWEPHPDVWLLVGVLAVGYAVALVRIGPTVVAPGTPVVTPLQLTSFIAGVLAMWVASDWPIHDLGEGYLFSIHMVQHFVFSIIGVPLLLIGTPAWLARKILSPAWLLTTVRWLARFWPATILFNIVVVITHTPMVVTAALTNGFVHFGIHVLLVLSSLIVWMPILSPLPEVPRLHPLMRMLFLFLQAVVPTIPASFLTFGERPLYRFYETVPRIYSLSALEDQRIAGLIMKIGAGIALWVIIAIVFFRWYAAEEADSNQRRKSRALDRELMGLQKT